MTKGKCERRNNLYLIDNSNIISINQGALLNSLNNIIAHKKTYTIQVGVAMKITFRSSYKSIPAGIQFNITDFCVITGKNGSGKTHLLEAMTDNNITTIIDDNGDSISSIQYISFGNLTPQIEEAYNQDQINSSVQRLWGDIKSVQSRIQSNDTPKEQQLDHILRTQQYPAVNQLIYKIMSNTSKSIDELTEDDVLFNMEVQSQYGIFTTKLAEVFKTYHERYIRNDFRRYQNERRDTHFSTLTDDEFIEKFGPKPWLLIDEIIKKAGLPYIVTPPKENDYESNYYLSLMDISDNTKVGVQDLSTGEKVLLSLAIAIYNSESSSGKPQLLLMDEPDASLHPNFSKKLIETLKDVIADKVGVRVVMTTHSPSTAALCPNNCLFEMNKNKKIPEMISTNSAIENLTDGIPYFKISLDNRLQIFVESKFDAIYFEQLFYIVKRIKDIDYLPIFLEPHSGTSNCTDVEFIVSRLCEAGNDLVRGIVDWDGKKTKQHPVYVLGCGRRYAIENYILDPFYVAISLIRENKLSFNYFSIQGMETYVDINKITKDEIQIITNKILTDTGIRLENQIACSLLNGWQVLLPDYFLKMRGHDWEELLKKTFNQLNAVSVNNNDSGLKLGVLRSILEFPQFLSNDILDTFLEVNQKA